MQNYELCTKSFILVIVCFFVLFFFLLLLLLFFLCVCVCVFFLNQIFSLFPIVKINANCVEICRVGNLEAEFLQVMLVQFFTILL